MRDPEIGPNEQPDFDARILERMKTNYAARGEQLKLRWRNGVIIPDGRAMPSVATSIGLANAKTAFLKLTQEFADQKRPVSSKSRASNYSPREFEKLPADQRMGFHKADFEKAMNALFSEKAIENVDYGRRGDERTKIVIRKKEKDDE
jgi:hypothetical protein